MLTVRVATDVAQIEIEFVSDAEEVEMNAKQPHLRLIT